MWFKGHEIILNEHEIESYEVGAISRTIDTLRHVGRNASPSVGMAIEKFLINGSKERLSVPKLPVVCYHYAYMREIPAPNRQDYSFEIRTNFSYLTKQLARIIVYFRKAVSFSEGSILIKNNITLIPTRHALIKQISFEEERNNALWNGVCVVDCDQRVMAADLVSEAPHARVANSPPDDSFPALLKTERFQHKLGYREDLNDLALGSHYVYYLFTKNCAKALLYGSKDAKNKSRRAGYGRR